MLSRLLRRSDGSSPLVVEPMRRRDLGAVMAIEQVSYPRPWTISVFQSELDLARRGQRHYLVARLDGELVGYAGVMFVVDDAHVTNIAVAASHRRHGVGTRLLAEQAWAAIERGCHGLTLEVRASNDAAQALYHEFGFVPAGVRKRYYENTEDAIVMWCTDLAEATYRERLAALCPEAAR